MGTFLGARDEFMGWGQGPKAKNALVCHGFHLETTRPAGIGVGGGQEIENTRTSFEHPCRWWAG